MLECMDWPPCSPYLNPIEEIWDTLKQAVYRRINNTSTMNDLRHIAQEELAHIHEVKIINLTNSMRKRFLEVIANDGGYTSY